MVTKQTTLAMNNLNNCLLQWIWVLLKKDGFLAFYQYITIINSVLALKLFFNDSANFWRFYEIFQYCRENDHNFCTGRSFQNQWLWKAGGYAINVLKFLLLCRLKVLYYIDTYSNGGFTHTTHSQRVADVAVKCAIGCPGLAGGLNSKPPTPRWKMCGPNNAQ